MKLTLFFAGLIALATALPAAEAPDSIADLSIDKGPPPSKTDDECMDHLATCLAHVGYFLYDRSGDSKHTNLSIRNARKASTTLKKSAGTNARISRSSGGLS
jgi:hypothetical protein